MASKELALMMSKYAMLPKGKANPTKEKITLTKAEINKLLRESAEKAAIDAIRLTQAIFFTVLCDKENADVEIMQRVWQEVEELSDSIVKKYVNAHDLVKTLADEYEIYLER